MGDMRDYTSDDYSGNGTVPEGKAAGCQSQDTLGYDDHFNDGVARTALRVAKYERPQNWPASASAMGRRVAGLDSGMRGDHEDAALRATLSNSCRERPAMWGKSSSEMRRYVEFQQGQESGYTDSAHLRLAGRMCAPPAGRDGWRYSLAERRWVQM